MLLKVLRELSFQFIEQQVRLVLPINAKKFQSSKTAASTSADTAEGLPGPKRGSKLIGRACCKLFCNTLLPTLGIG